MKKTISTKRVLNELLAAFNEQSESCGYYRETKNFETANECSVAKNVICELMREFGFREGAEYITKKEQKTVGGVTFTWYRKVVKES